MVSRKLTPAMLAAVEELRFYTLDDPGSWFTLQPNEIRRVHEAMVKAQPQEVWPNVPTPEMLKAAENVRSKNEPYVRRFHLAMVYEAFRRASKTTLAEPVATVVHKQVVPAVGKAEGRTLYTIHVTSDDSDLQVGEILYALRGGV